MTKLFPTAALLALALLITACRPSGPQPSDTFPPSRPAVQTGAPAQAAESAAEDTQPAPEAAQPGAPQADTPASQQDAPQSTGRRVLGAIGKAVRNSVTGESRK